MTCNLWHRPHISKIQDPNLNYFLSFLFPSSYNITNTTCPYTVKKYRENKYIIRSLQPGDGKRLNSLQMSQFRQKTKPTDRWPAATCHIWNNTVL